MPSLRAQLIALRLVLALALVLVPVGAVGASRDLTRTTATAHSRAASDAPSPTPSLALRPGARLAPERILDFFSTPLALNYVITDEDSTPPDQDAAGPSASRTPGHDGAEQPDTVPANPSATAPPSSSTTSPTATAKPSRTPSDTQPPAPSESDHTVSLYSLLGAAALLTVALTTALALRKARQRSTADRTTDKDSQPADASAEARGKEGLEGVMLLDAALRTMAYYNAQLPQPTRLPAVRGALIGTTTVRVLPEDPSTEPPAPFTAGRNGRWVLPDDANLLDADTTAQAPAPHPALAVLGTTSNEELLLLNLASLPALLLDGEPEHVREVCTALAVELTTSPWADSLELITVGCGDGLDRLLPAPAVTPLPDSAHAVREATERLLEAHQSPDPSHHPLVVLCAAPLSADTAWHFADLATTTAPRPLTLIAPAHTTAAHFPDAPSLDTADNRAQYLEPLDTWVTLQRLTPTAYQQISAALGPATSHPPRPHHTGQDTAPDPVPEAELTPVQSEQAPKAHSSQPQGSPVPGTATSSTAPDDGNRDVFPALLSTLRPATTDPTHPSETASAGTPPAQSVTHPMASASIAPPGADAARQRDESAPQIRVLGPVEVDGVDATGHGPRIAQLAALIYFKPGRTADAVCTDMDPAHPWSTTTLNARLHQLRAALGNDPTGQPYVPRRKTGDDPYHLNPTVTCDWTRFQHLTHDALPDESTQAPDIEQLEEALALVRGTPFDGKPLPWAEPLQQEMTTAIAQIAHTIATHRMSPGPHHNLDRARQAIAHGIDSDSTAELLYRDWILVEDAAGNRHGVHTAITRLQHINRALNSPLEQETEQLINSLLDPARHTQASRP
ncbi:hypothetical protein [Streptomyces sp. NPDC057280]|uniref:hypothetical protein n=1 Tax=Streptomyces sp. NPDC057280 TaxID=3346081 RepID=UPI00362C6A73